MNIDPAALEEMRLRLTMRYSHRGDGIATQNVNPDGPDAWEMIQQLVRELELAGKAA